MAVTLAELSQREERLRASVRSLIRSVVALYRYIQEKHNKINRCGNPPAFQSADTYDPDQKEGNIQDWIFRIPVARVISVQL